ncbi:hypothetical protein CCP3SC1_450028 [Gammaproteobacteria bacterium]
MHWVLSRGGLDWPRRQSGYFDLKVVVGVVSGSHALVVDALYSGKDVVTSFLIILGLRFTKQPVDEEHQFGHGKAEFLFSVIIGLVLIAITALVLYLEAGK